MNWPGKEWQGALLLAIVIASALGSLWFLLGFFPPVAAPTGSVLVSLNVEAPGWTLSYAAETMNRTVLGFLLEASESRGFAVEWTQWESLGATKVDAINGFRDGQGGRYWQYWVNGQYGNIGADRYLLEDGDHVLWKYTTYPPEGGGHEA